MKTKTRVVKKNRIKSPKNKKIIIPVLIVSIILSALYLYIRSNLVQPLQIAEVSSDLPKITISHNCDTTPPTTTTIHWNAPPGTITQIELESRDGQKLWYSKKVDANSNYTDLNGFVGSNHSTNPAKDKPLIVDKNTTYYAWAWYGTVNLPATTGFKPYNCLTDAPVPTPTGMTHTCSADGTKVTFKWDDTSPSKKYSFALMDLSQKPFIWNKSDSTSHWRGGDLSTNVYELPITPGKEYQWFIQTNSNGPHSKSSQSTKLNFTCESKPPTPSNTRYTCSPDGTSVKLAWDSVDNVESYKVRLDDKKGNVVNHDNIRDTQKVLSITPNTSYSWWMHSHKNGYDSNQTASIDFSCQAAATPATPPKSISTPVVRPTIAPTATPKPTATPTPTPSATHITSQQIDPPDAQIVDEAPLTTTISKPSLISRFFSWLQSIFGINN